jgi:hypothetical protein
MQLKCAIAPVMASWVGISLFDWVYHGVLLMPLYVQTAFLWRPMAEIQAMMPWNTVQQLLLAAVLSFLFSRHYEGKGLREGVRFGLYVGALMGVLHLGAYAYLPMPLSLALLWTLGGVLQGIWVGVILAFVYPRLVCNI